MSNVALAKITDLDDRSLGEVFVKSGYFSDTRDAAQAIVKILAGRELGFGPMASMQGIYVVQGKVSLSATLIGAKIKGSGRYDYRVEVINDNTCSIRFYEHGKPIGESTFTIADAKRAQTKNLDKFPRNMLFARALTNGARWYCPDVFSGAIYTPEELGADVNEDGQPIEAPVVRTVDTTTGEIVEQPPAEPLITKAQWQGLVQNAKPVKTVEELLAMIADKWGVKQARELTAAQYEQLANEIDVLVKEQAGR